MSDKVQTIDANDIERHMNEQACRAEMVCFSNKRYSYVQKILLKAEPLSDKDFETAFATFESLVQSLYTRRK